jgi:hypothetical protein
MESLSFSIGLDETILAPALGNTGRQRIVDIPYGVQKNGRRSARFCLRNKDQRWLAM